MSKQERKRVFISYGHDDGAEFTLRLVSSLKSYVEVFWDKELRYGQFDKQLETEIEKCDFFVIVMTPAALRDDGYCRTELEYADKKGKIVVPIKVEGNCGFDEDNQTWGKEHSKDQYADFRDDFDKGFQRLTQILLGKPYLSWEYFTRFNDTDLLQQLDAGRLPNSIAEELAEWVLVHKAWDVASYYINQYYPDIALGSPTTIKGVTRSCKMLFAYASQKTDSTISHFGLSINKIIETYNGYLNHPNFGSNYATSNLIKNTNDFRKSSTAGNLDANKLHEINNFSNFDVAEKLRELINIHARRSRYLY